MRAIEIFDRAVTKRDSEEWGWGGRLGGGRLLHLQSTLSPRGFV